MSKVIGNNILLLIGGVALVGQTSGDIDISCDLVDVTSKSSSGKWGSYIPGRLNASLSCEGLYDPTASGVVNSKTLFNHIVAGKELVFRMGQLGDDDYVFAGKALIEKYSVGAPIDEITTYNISLKVTGELDMDTNDNITSGS